MPGALFDFRQPPRYAAVFAAFRRQSFRALRHDAFSPPIYDYRFRQAAIAASADILRHFASYAADVFASPPMSS